MRDRFPLLSRRTYLASHSLGAVPASASAALQEYYRHWAELGILAWDGPWWEMMKAFCSSLEQLLGAPSGTVVPMLNVTRAMAGVASSFDYGRARNRIVLGELEFTTCFPFWRGQERLGAELVVVPSADRVSVSLPALLEAIDERTLLVVSSHAYFRSGALQDLRALSRAAHRVGALVLGDGYQTVGCVPVDVVGLEVDFFVGGCHKWLCGGPGAGYLYVRQELIPQLQPRLTGWFGLADPFEYDADFGSAPPHPESYRFLCGTPNIPAFYAAREGIAAVLELGIETIRRRSVELTSLLVAGARERGLGIRSPLDPQRRNGMVCLDFEGDRQAQKDLQEQGIIVDWRPDCGLRVSPHFYNDEQDLARFWSAIDESQSTRESTVGVDCR
ncbi:MAG: aminotransferase class V-fold PLP-dependent enzyme [Armatimonadetes bacterium]|nr:aminotransferase class V-fold PLP-dependent enzyme [Armatimonadota bacterium]